MMTVKQFTGPELDRLREVTMTSLDNQGAFDAAWWLAILRGLREADCPGIFTNYHRTISRTQRSYKSKKLEKRITKGCPQVSCCGHGCWIIIYNSLLNIKFTHHTKAIAFADDLVIMTKAVLIREAENIMKAELCKISTQAR